MMQSETYIWLIPDFLNPKIDSIVVFSFAKRLMLLTSKEHVELPVWRCNSNCMPKSSRFIGIESFSVSNRRGHQRNSILNHFLPQHGPVALLRTSLQIALSIFRNLVPLSVKWIKCIVGFHGSSRDPPLYFLTRSQNDECFQTLL